MCVSTCVRARAHERPLCPGRVPNYRLEWEQLDTELSHVSFLHFRDTNYRKRPAYTFANLLLLANHLAIQVPCTYRHPSIIYCQQVSILNVNLFAPCGGACLHLQKLCVFYMQGGGGVGARHWSCRGESVHSRSLQRKPRVQFKMKPSVCVSLSTRVGETDGNSSLQLKCCVKRGVGGS